MVSVFEMLLQFENMVFAFRSLEVVLKLNRLDRLEICVAHGHNLILPMFVDPHG